MHSISISARRRPAPAARARAACMGGSFQGYRRCSLGRPTATRRRPHRVRGGFWWHLPMPDFSVQCGTSLPRNAKRRNQPKKMSDPTEAKRGQGAAAPSPSLTAAAYHGSQASPGPAGRKALQPITGSREQRKKARAARFPRVIVADTVTDYRRVVPLIVDPTDIVLEVGCCSGATTNVLFDYCKCAVGTLHRCFSAMQRRRFHDSYPCGSMQHAATVEP